MPRFSSLGCGAGLALVVACGGDTATNPGGSDNGGPVVNYTISGTVLDSVLAMSLPGVTVTAGAKTDTTDVLGQYSIVLAAGPVSVQVNVTDYETFTTTFDLVGNQVLNIPLRRDAPWVKRVSWFATSAELMRVIIGDLEGADAIDQSRVTAFAVGPGFGTLIFSGGQVWSQQSGLEWAVTLLGTSAPTQITWNVPDTAGNVARFVCLAGSSCSPESQ